MRTNLLWSMHGLRIRAGIHHPTRGWPRRLLPLFVGIVSACGCSQAGNESLARNADGGPRVVRITTVSGDSALPPACRGFQAESFPQLVAHPLDPMRLSMVYFQDGNLAAVGAASGDGGRSWWRAPISEASACSGGPASRSRLYNPLLTQGADGWVHYGASSGRVAVHSSADAAGVWGRGIEPGTLGSEDSAENLNLLTDPAAPERLRALWTEYDYPAPEPFPLFTATTLQTSLSVDRGRSFSAQQLVARAPLGRFIINARMARSSDGATLVCYDSVAAILLINAFTLTRTPFEMACTRSVDGRTWTAPVRAGPALFLPLPDPEGRETPGADAQGIAFSAKFDLATGSGGLAALVHADLVDGRGQLKLALSEDDGASWSATTVAIEREAAVFMPSVAIDGKGRIGLFWYDWTDDRYGDDALSTTAWFALSADRGLSWKTVRIAGPFDLRAAYEEGLEYDGGALGTYQDLIALPDGFAAAYTVGPPLSSDGRTDVQFARLAVDP
jgi:hypothetical protein